MNAKSFIIASAAAAMFIAGGAAAGAHEGHEHDADTDAKIKCEGVNACKGQSACATADSACAGHNGCAGKGFLKLSKADCDAAKAAGE